MNFFVQPLFFGILSAFFALVMEQIAYVIGGPKMELEFFFGMTAIILASAAIEEVIKFAMIFKNSAAMENKREIILSSIFFGLGFSTVELFLYYFNETVSWQNSFIPLLGVATIHIVTSLFSGFVISQKRQFLFSALAAVAANFLIHAGYNLAAINF